MDNNQEMIPHQKSLSPVDSSPLQSSMERNRESLKIKLMVRRSANQLVEQGILPPLKTSPAIHEQKKLLERAKTGDLLKAKIQQRPNREELERRHILESHESHIDPSLADKYRMLEKAILVDQLNSKISHRPGPLELIEKNILHANEPIERIVKEGLVPFKASTDNLFLEDDSQSSEGDINSQTDANGLLKSTVNIISDQPIALNSNTVEIVDESQVTSPLNVINLNLPLHASVITQSALVPKLTLHLPAAVSSDHETTITLPCLVTESLLPITTTASIEKSSNEKLPVEIVKEPTKVNNNIDGNIKHHISSFLQNNQKFASSSGKEKIKKKCKIKPTAKIKAIKFHEYKGPPNSQRNNSSSSCSTTTISPTAQTSSCNNNKKLAETNYELIMQQQCLLEYLEGIYKNPNSNKSESDAHNQEKQLPIHEKSMEKLQDEVRPEDVKKPFITIFPSKSPTSISATIDKDAVITDTNKLGKMKVSELKSYLKKLNLPVSGPKPLLIERLKPYLPFKPSDICKSFEKSESLIKPMQDVSKDALSMKLSNNSVDSLDTQLSFKDDDIVKEQQRQIEELQRKLLESQSELEQIRLSKVVESNDNSCINSFQIIPDTNNIQTMYDTKYQLPNKVSTVFVVGVTPINTETSSSTIPMVVQEQADDAENNNTSSSNNNHIIDPNIVLSPQSSSEPSSDIEINREKSGDTLYSNAIVQDDINDVLEILLKNEKWNGGSESFHPDKNGIIDEPKIMLNPRASFSGSIDNENAILGGALVNNSELLTAVVDENVKSEGLLSFPMEVEENSNSNIDSLSSYFNNNNNNKKDPHECNVFNNYTSLVKNTSNNNNNENNNNNNTFDKSADNNSYNGIRNSLIGNFDNGMFDTFKTNIVNSASNNPLLSDVEHKEIKYNDKFIFNGINNFDMFGHSHVELPATTPMDFENIISYDIYQQHDPFFSIDNFQNLSERENFINSQISNTSNAMFCEDDNMFEAGNDIKW